MHGTSILRHTIILSAMLVLGCGVLTTPMVGMAAETAATPARQEPTTPPSVANASNDDIYTLQHQVVPGILFSDKGSLMFSDLSTGRTGPFIAMAGSALGGTYASGIRFAPEHHPGFDMVLISFPVPLAETNCFHAALVKSAGAFRYITLEKGNTAEGANAASFLCEWSTEHKHLNFGPRSYKDLAAFRSDVLSIMEQQGKGKIK